MKNLYEPSAVHEIKSRVARLRPESPRQWGRMNSAQAVAHCALSMEWVWAKESPNQRRSP
jgi:hypothetical protein